MTKFIKQTEKLVPGIYLDSFEATKVNKILDEWGVCVVKNHFTKREATEWKNDIVNWLVKLNPELKDKWDNNNLPYGPRLGMMQSLISHCPTVWTIREKFYPLFKEMLGEEELLTSIDGATVHPPIYGKGSDWPHIDQTTEGIICNQAQVVLSDTTASFRCTPQSHLRHRDILELCGATNADSEWLKFKNNEIHELKGWFENWQIPIHVQAGSLIFWRSNTIHSAQKNENKDPGWRCVVYVCMRAKSQYSDEQLKTLANAAQNGRTTNHWGTIIFPKRPGFWKQARKASEIEMYTEHPEKLVIEYSPLLKKLTAQIPWTGEA